MWCQNRRPLERKTKSFVTYEGTFSIIFPTEWQQKGLSASIMKLAQCGVSFLVIQGQECLKKARNKLVPGVQNRRVISRCLLLRVPADKSYLQCMKENIKKKSPRGHFELLCWDVCESCFSWRTLLRCTVSVFRAVGGLIKKRKKSASFVLSWNFPSSFLLPTGRGVAGHLAHCLLIAFPTPIRGVFGQRAFLKGTWPQRNTASVPPAPQTMLSFHTFPCRAAGFPAPWDGRGAMFSIRGSVHS